MIIKALIITNLIFTASLMIKIYILEDKLNNLADLYFKSMKIFSELMKGEKK